ncbi:MAG TPA: transposase [Frankiaceae bacterium]|nr:transposase [Frankiaceae bacterium]
MPETLVVTVEHQLLKVCCPGCQAHTRAELPDDVERGAFGPRLRATVVMFAVMLLSRRQTLMLLSDMFGARISLGSLERILKDASAALAAPWEAIKRAVQAAEVANADETSWARAGQRLWLWSALSATAACYRIDANPGDCQRICVWHERKRSLCLRERRTTASKGKTTPISRVESPKGDRSEKSAALPRRGVPGPAAEVAMAQLVPGSLTRRWTARGLAWTSASCLRGSGSS